MHWSSNLVHGFYKKREKQHLMKFLSTVLLNIHFFNKRIKLKCYLKKIKSGKQHKYKN